eukprot:712262-Amphidinium_carterae.1
MPCFTVFWGHSPLARPVALRPWPVARPGPKGASAGSDSEAEERREHELFPLVFFWGCTVHSQQKDYCSAGQNDYRPTYFFP